MDNPADTPFACKGECPQCSRDRGRQSPQCASAPGGLTGWRFSLAAIVAFLLPLVVACGAAVVVSRPLEGDARALAMALAVLPAVAVAAVPAAVLVRRLGASRSFGKENV